MQVMLVTCFPQDLTNVMSAREFVWWFNGHPDYANLPIDISKVRP